MRQTDETKKDSKQPKNQSSHPTEDELGRLREQVEELKGQLDERTNAWKRALADYQNLEKRMTEEKRDFVRFAAKNFIEKLLGVIDDLEKADAHLKNQGLELALKNLQTLLIDEGVERIDTRGKNYDIHTMEAISLVEGDKDNKVIEELRAGYTMHGSVLRPAQVKVSKKKEKVMPA